MAEQCLADAAAKGIQQRRIAAEIHISSHSSRRDLMAGESSARIA